MSDKCSISDKGGVTNILMAGVGGQGTLLASEILSEVLMQGGYDVKKAEVHGMAQRGGSVVSHVRFGPKVYSSIIPEGDADVLFGFELLETYRYLSLVKKSGTVIVNNLRIAPPSVALGVAEYPEDIESKLGDYVDNVRVVNGLELAEQAGNPRTVNTVLLGALSRTLAPSHEQWVAAIKALVPERFLEVNLNAFELGRKVD
ncbi:MAG: indolepyruvate oxidoreductase subunit beta [Desulfuromonadales bacterium]|nr:indolepyruvate oxidoreductase subunit beta [Desulfuromonadales bacterium]